MRREVTVTGRERKRKKKGLQENGSVRESESEKGRKEARGGKGAREGRRGEGGEMHRRAREEPSLTQQHAERAREPLPSLPPHPLALSAPQTLLACARAAHARLER